MATRIATEYDMLQMRLVRRGLGCLTINNTDQIQLEKMGLLLLKILITFYFFSYFICKFNMFNPLF